MTVAVIAECGSSLNIGLIVGVTVGAVVAGVIIAVLIAHFMKHNRRKWDAKKRMELLNDMRGVAYKPL